MGFLEQIFGTELSGVGRYVTAFVLVMALIALTAWLMRRFGDTRAPKQGARGRQQRLAVLDSAIVDARRRLVLIRRDNVEHLILIGGPTDVVVEPNIVRASALAAPAPRPARSSVFEPAETMDYETPLIPSEPAYEEPQRPAAPPQPQAQILRPAAPEPQRSAPRPAPAPAQRLDPQYADMAHRLEAALRKPASDGDGAARPQPRTPTPPMPRTTEPRPAAAAPQIRAPEPRQPAPASAPAPAPKTAADVFGNLEDEMASLLRPGNKTTQ